MARRYMTRAKFELYVKLFAAMHSTPLCQVQISTLTMKQAGKTKDGRIKSVRAVCFTRPDGDQVSFDIRYQGIHWEAREETWKQWLQNMKANFYRSGQGLK